LNIVANDKVAGRRNTYEVTLDVPQFDEEKLSASSLVVADRVSRKEDLKVSVQFYNFGYDEKTQKLDADIQYEIVKARTGDKIIDLTEAAASIPRASYSQVTVKKLIPVKMFVPGQYELRLKVTDTIRNQTLVPSARFTVR
jgi:hypothetical protein